jgi:hypothetical protein
MATFKEKHDAAGARYAAAVAELRAAYGELAAFDRKASMPGFGYPPEIVPLRQGSRQMFLDPSPMTSVRRWTTCNRAHDVARSHDRSFGQAD